jgi:glycine cleavage system H protein
MRGGRMRYSKEHVWVRESEGLLRIGLSDYAQKELGELTFIEFPELGVHVNATDVLCSIDSLKAASDVYAPVSGTVTEVNAALVDSGASVVNDDPLGEGWLLILNPDDISDLEQLLTDDAYREYTEG